MSQHSRDDFSGRDNRDASYGDSSDGTNKGNFPTERDFEKDLLGYVLGALDERETRQIDELIREHPDLEDELQLIRMSIAPLEQLKADCDPPVGLARRACESVASFRSTLETDQFESNQLESDELRSEKRMKPAAKFELYRHHASRRDLIAIVASIVALAAVAFPVINHNRFNSRVIQCQNNMRQTSMALLRYADAHGGQFVGMPSESKLAVAGSYAPTLIDQGFVDDDGIFFCSARRVEDSQGRQIPTTDQVRNAQGSQLIDYQRRMGGDFGYSIGYYSEGRYVAPEKQGRSNVVLLADAPSFDRPGRSSSNHGGYGQNCLFEDGHIKMVKVNSVAGDAIYENDLGQIAPGAHELDSVIAPSHARLNFKSEVPVKN